MLSVIRPRTAHAQPPRALARATGQASTERGRAAAVESFCSSAANGWLELAERSPRPYLLEPAASCPRIAHSIPVDGAQTAPVRAAGLVPENPPHQAGTAASTPS